MAGAPFSVLYLWQEIRTLKVIISVGDCVLTIVSAPLNGNGAPTSVGAPFSVTIHPFAPNPCDAWGMTESTWINLAELDMLVDPGLEDLVRACWARGVGVVFASEGPGGIHDGPASIGFKTMQSAFRWQRLTGCGLEEGDEEFGTVAEASFPLSLVPHLVPILQDLNNEGLWKEDHEQVMLPDLGFSVDRGLEALIRACWRRGIMTSSCCIGTGKKWREGPNGHIGFYYSADANRWTEVTGRACDLIDDEEIATEAEFYFDAAEIPALLVKLNSV